MDRKSEEDEDNDNLLCNDQLQQITKELKEIKNAMFHKNNKKEIMFT